MRKNIEETKEGIMAVVGFASGILLFLFVLLYLSGCGNPVEPTVTVSPSDSLPIDSSADAIIHDVQSQMEIEKNFNK